MYQFGKNISVALYTNDNIICATLFGIKQNFVINFDIIKERLKKLDKNINYEINSGIKNNLTTGFPIHITVYNNEKKTLKNGIISPNFGELLYLEKNDGFHYQNLLTGKITYPLVICGLICEQILENKYNIKILSHINSILNINDQSFNINNNDFKNYLYLKNDDFPTIDPRAKMLYYQLIKKTKQKLDTLGGSLETIIYNLPKCLGEPFFDKFESKLSHLLFTIPSLKGLMFGNIDNRILEYGSKSIDNYCYIDNKIKLSSNFNGGLLGGMTSGYPVSFKTYFKAPLPDNQAINTINILKGINTHIKKNDLISPIKFHTFIPIIESFAAIVITDFLYEKR